MALLNFSEDITILIDRLQNDIAKSKNCEGSDSFNESYKKIASSFYAYFQCSPKGSSVRTLIDIQAELELSDKCLKEFEIYSKNLFNITFTLRALGIEIDKLQRSIKLIYDEVFEFWTVVKSIEVQNYKIIKILTSVWKVLQELKKSLYVLSMHQKEFIENNLHPSMTSFSEYMSCSKNEDLNSMLKSFGSKTMYFAETLRQMKYMNELLQNHQKMKLIHPMFSFQLILMINDPRISLVYDPTIKIKTSKIAALCVGSCVSKSHKQMLSEADPLIKSPEAVLNSIEGQAIEIGSAIFKTTYAIKEVHCASLRREKIVLTDIQAKRMVLLRGLNELQNIVCALDEMDNCNDTLVGKMTKTRPLFKQINKYLKLDLSTIQSVVDDPSSDLSKQMNSL